MRVSWLAIAALLVLAGAGSARGAVQEPPPVAHGFGVVAEAPEDHVSESQRAKMWQAIDANAARLELAKDGARPAFIWPLRAARGFSQPAVDRVSYYVDHDPASGSLSDYQCGTRTYDRDTGYNHQGIDISIWPDSWNMMQTGQLEIVAAAPGTIVFRSDGNFDRNCTFGSDDWNAVAVRHDDGSVAWYGHMKSGSPTPKGVGARVVAGEFLGNIGSSGVSL